MNTGTVNPPAADSLAKVALPLESSLQIQNVERELVRLKEVFELNGPTAIDVSGLTAIDTAGVQLLLAICREGVRRRICIEFRGDSPALTQALKLLGLEEILMHREAA